MSEKDMQLVFKPGDTNNYNELTQEEEFELFKQAFERYPEIKVCKDENGNATIECECSPLYLIYFTRGIGLFVPGYLEKKIRKKQRKEGENWLASWIKHSKKMLAKQNRRRR